MSRTNTIKPFKLEMCLNRLNWIQTQSSFLGKLKLARPCSSAQLSFFTTMNNKEVTLDLEKLRLHDMLQKLATYI